MTTERDQATPDPEGTAASRVLKELAEQLAQRTEASESEVVDAYGAWRCHVVAVCIGGDHLFYTLCGECLHRQGPFDDEFDADRVALHHRWTTRGFGRGVAWPAS